MLGRVTEDGTSQRCLLCSASASCVLSNFVFLHILLPLTSLAFLSVAHCFWGTFLGNHSPVERTWTQRSFFTCPEWLQDIYFPCCLDLNFLIRPLNISSSFSSKCSISSKCSKSGRNQTFVLDHIPGNLFSFSVQIWILVNCKDICITHCYYFG